MNNLSILAAEMTQYLLNIRMSNTNCITKNYCVPYFSCMLQEVSSLDQTDFTKKI